MKSQMSNVKCQMSKGFTLIELIVVLAVFILIIGATVSIFMSIIGRQKSILEEQELLNQTSYATEYMSRTIREAVKDSTGSCLPTSGSIYLLTHYNLAAGFYQGIKFVAKDGTCEEFFLDTDGLLKEVKSSQAPQNMISNKFTVKYLRFVINGNKSLQVANQSDLVQPRITMLLDVKTQSALNQKEKVIQTTVSQINLIAP